VTKVVSLTTKPPVAQEIKDNIIEILKQYLEKAEKGEISCVIVIAGFPGGIWSNDMSSTLDFPTAIGKLEIAKQEWIGQELSQAQED
jgi:hypothetical protein